MKFLKILLFAVLIAALVPKAVSAYFTPPDQQIPNFENSVYGKPTTYNIDSNVDTTLEKMIISLAQKITGPMTEVGQQAVGPKSGALYALSGLIAEMYKNPPASSVEYFADLGRNLGIVKPAYAQGVGFEGLRNLLPLWKASRNLAYIFFVIVFLYMGLAIMFRVKLDPKTVITIQNAIPKLVIALILVTFSYAIVGLMIDLIYLMIYIGILALQGPIDLARSQLNDPSLTVTLQQQKFTGLSFFEAMGLIFGGGAQAIGQTIGGILFPVEFFLLGAGIFLNPALIAAVAIPVLLVLILAIIALFLVFKLFFALLMSYIYIIISVITAPIQIMLGALPGSIGGFGSWFKNLMANILVFPAVALFLLIGWLLTTSVGPTWTPPVVSVSGRSLTALLGLGMLLLVNKIPEMIQAAFKIKPQPYGTAIGEALGAPKVMIGKTIGTLTTVADIDKSIQQVTGEQHGVISGILSRRRRGGGGEATGEAIDNLPR